MSSATCRVDGCDRTDLKGGTVRSGRVALEARGLCDMHYQRWKRHGDPAVVLPAGSKPKRHGCEIEGCDRKHMAKGFCEYHYKRQNERRIKYYRAYRKANGHNRKHRTGWTNEEYDAAHEAQQGCCAMCGRPGSDYKRPLHADHCHTTGRKRGLLCPTCNSRIEPVLTQYFSDPDFRLRWQQYLSVGG